MNTSDSIIDNFGNNANVSLPGITSANSLGSNKSIQIDTVIPIIQNITTTRANGNYGTGTIPISITFNKAINVIGTPQINLNIGNTRNINYSSGTGTDTLTFNYSITSGDDTNSQDLNVTSINLNGGIVRDTALNNANLTLPVSNSFGALNSNKNIKIDTIIPTITNVTSSTLNGSYTVGSSITINVEFSKAIDVSGIPQLNLNTGTNVNYSNKLNSNTLSFVYNIQAGDNTNRLNYSNTSSLIYPVSTVVILDNANNNANLSLPAIGSTNSLGINKNIIIDTTSPTITNVTSSKNNDTYSVGELIPINIQFSENVYVTGNPSLSLNSGGSATYISGTSTNILTFNYIVSTNENTNDLDYNQTTIVLDAANSIRDLAGNIANTTLPTAGSSTSLAGNKDIIIDTLGPTITNVTSSITNGSYSIGSVIPISVVYSEPINVTGTPNISMNTGGTAFYSSGSGTNTLIFNYTISSNENTSKLAYRTNIINTSINLTDNEGNVADITLPAIGSTNSLSGNKSIIIDTIQPTILGVTSSVTNGSYNSGSVIPILINFSENINVTGTPQLTLETGTTDITINYTSGTGTSTLTFNYTIGTGQSANPLDYKAINSLTLNGGSIQDLAQNNAILTLPQTSLTNSLSSNKSIFIDTVAPVISYVSSSISDGSYNNGTTIPINIIFNETVVVTGVPSILLNTGGSGTIVNYSSGSGTNTLTFNYLIQSSHSSSDLEYSGTSLNLAGASITDSAGNSLVNTLPAIGSGNSLSDRKNIIIDSISPTITNVTSTKANGSYTVNEIIDINIVFSEIVNVTGTPQITLETGTTDAIVDYTSGTGTNTLIFNYTISATENSNNLEYQSINSLNLNGGTISDNATNNANITLPTIGGGNSLSDNKTLVVNTSAAIVNNVSSTSTNGTYGIGRTIPITLTFNKTVNVTGTPQLTLETGTTDAVVNYTSGSGTNTLTFNYTISSGETSTDLNYRTTNALDLNGGTITDNFGLNALTTLPLLTASTSLAGNKAIVIDTNSPNILSVTTTKSNGSYTIGEIIQINITFSENVNITGTPQITLETGTTDAVVNYTSGNGTSILMFEYTVQAGNNTSKLNYVNTNSLTLNGGTIKNSTGNNALLSLPATTSSNSLGGSKTIVINTTTPTITNVTSTATNGNYTTGSVIPIVITFSENITVSGTPQIILETGTTDAVVNYSSGSTTSSLTFNYTVSSGEITSRLNYRSTNSLSLNGGTIQDSAGNNANLTLPVLNANNSLRK